MAATVPAETILLVPEFLGRWKKPPRGLIYHYTSIQGAYEILASGEIFATNLLYFNDTLESNYRRAIIKECVESATNKIPVRNRVLLAWLKEMESLSIRASKRVLSYGCCFTSLSDEISQWTRYGDEGLGVALGFSRAAFDKLSPRRDLKGNRAYVKVNLPVVYDRSTQKRRLSSVIDRVVNEFATNNDPNVVGLSGIVATAMCASAFKSRNWRDELEERMVVGSLDDRHLSVRKSQRGLSVHIPILLRARDSDQKIPSLRKIIVGPRADFESMEFAFRTLLTTLGISKRQVRIEHSRIGFQ